MTTAVGLALNRETRRGAVRWESVATRLAWRRDPRSRQICPVVTWWLRRGDKEFEWVGGFVTDLMRFTSG